MSEDFDIRQEHIEFLVCAKGSALMLHYTCPSQVNLVVPVCYLLFWALLLGFSLHSEPLVCGVGLVIMLTGVPVYFLGVYWKNKPKCIYDFIEWATYLGQRVFFVVFPQFDPIEVTPEWTDKSSLASKASGPF